MVEVFKCKRCGDEFTNEELRELKEIGEAYSKFPFLCPDCFDEFQRLDSEDQMRYLAEDRYDW
jgi:hypothetical protein